MSNDPMLEMFVYENVQLTERLVEVMIEGEQLGGFNDVHINEIFRVMHTIKGSSAMMEYDQISGLAHRLEDMFFYIREHEDATPDWHEITDICLLAADFFKEEVAKIQSGLPSDGDIRGMVAQVEQCMAKLKGEAAAPPPEPPPSPEPAPEPAGTPAAPAVGAPSDDDALEVLIRFEDGCKMENIRAYQIVNTLLDYADSIVSEPADLLEDCSDEIISNGLRLTINTKTSSDKLRNVIAEALFVKSIDMSQTGGNAAPGNAPTPVPTAPEAPAVVQQAPATPAAPPAAVVETPAIVMAPTPAAPDTARSSVITEIKQNFISVNVEKLDKLMDLMGEIVISVAMVVGNPDLAGLQLDNFEKASSQLLKNTSELQNIIMSVRMLPISSTFHKMSRIVRDTSKKLSKEIELTILGEETEVDKNIIDNLGDPLMHIIRNAIDHGIEDNREDRIAAGKHPTGKIVLEARNSGSEVIISCTDDGRGLDRDRILAKAARNGLLTKPENEYTDKEIFQFIMNPGFSTNEQVTELSGRGVGMDVVKQNIDKVGGAVQLDSEKGKGMTVAIYIPLTLAILQSIEISVGKNVYLIPTLNIRESFKPNPEDIIIDPDGKEMIMFRGECFSIVRLHRIFGVETQITEFGDGIMIMIEDDGRMTAVFADLLVGEQQAVVKPIPNFITERIGHIFGISGCTLLGDGSISLIIDVKSLTQGGV